MRKTIKLLFLPIIFLVLNFCVGLGTLAGEQIELSISGVEEQIERPKADWSSIYLGTFQSQYSDYLDQNNFARDVLVKNYDSILHAINASNNNITYGRNGYLYETGYVASYMNCNSMADYSDYAFKLSAIHYALSLRGKEFVYIISPSKAEIYNEYLPSATSYNQYPDRITEHYLLKNALEQYSVPYVDATLIMYEMKTNNLSPFYKEGIHWSELAAIYTLNEALEEKLNYTYSVSNIPADADIDLYALANVWQKPLEDEFYRVNILSDEEMSDKNLLLFGTSFCGQWMHMLRASEPVFDNVTHYRYLQFQEELESGKYSLSQLNETIDENHIIETVNNADIIVFETNANAVFDSHKTIVDYLYQNYVLNCKIEIPDLLFDFTSEKVTSFVGNDSLYAQENSGRWTTEEFDLTFSWDKETNISVLINGNAFQPDYQIHVYLNGIDYGYADIIGNNIGSLSFKKEDLIIGENSLKLKTENALSPSEISDSSDSRKLGIFLRQLLIREERD